MLRGFLRDFLPSRYLVAWCHFLWPKLAKPNEIMAAIVKGVPKFPETIKPPVRDLLQRMLVIDRGGRARG
jgi:hypothetical protein